MPETPLLIRGARQVIPMSGPAGPRGGAAMDEALVIPNGAVLIEGDRIVEVGSAARVERLALSREAVEYDATGKIVIPGFVDPSTCLVGPPAGPWEGNAGDRLEAAVRVVRGFSGTRAEMEVRARIRRLVRCGVTAVDGHGGYGLDRSSELKALKAMTERAGKPIEIRRRLAAARRAPPETECRADEYLAEAGEEVLASCARRGLCDGVDLAPGSFSAEGARQFAERVAGLGLPLRLIAEGPELETYIGPPPATVEGLERVAESQLTWLLSCGAVAVLTPAVRFYDATLDLPPARMLIDEGVPVALGTGFDYHDSPVPNPQFVISLACALMGMTAAEALTACTLNAAWAVGLGEMTGSLEHGKWADVLVLGVSDYRQIPLDGGTDLVRLAIRKGQVIFPHLEAPG